MEPAKRTVGKYEVIGVLGQGGTGVVYDALGPDGAPVALKVMHDALAGDRQIRGRFEREAAILRRLVGEHVCPILDSGEVVVEAEGGARPKTLVYLALPKIQGISLADRIAKDPLDVDVALDIMRGILAALASAHRQGVIHRDLKPANVLLRDGEHVVVVDFGMSKIVTGTGTGTTNLTTHNMVFGTPEYMSPEQARGDDLDARCDVYAAGVILYEMLAGTPPFTGESPLIVLTAHLTSDLPMPSAQPRAAGRVTPALERVIVHALAREPEKRYASAARFAEALRRARAAPDDVDAVSPSAVASPTSGSDAFARTIPATEGPPAPDGDIATAPTLLGNERPRVPSSRPPAVPTRSSRPPAGSSIEPASGRRAWLVAWIVVSLASIASGVYFALNR